MRQGKIAGGRLPLARTKGLLVESVGEETVVYDTESKEAHCLSPLAATVFACCDGEASVGEVAQLAGGRLGEPVDAAGVIAAVAQLQEHALLDRSAVRTAGGMSRRDLARKTARVGAAAAATPLIVSVMAPAAYAAASCAAACASCTNPTRTCCTGSCGNQGACGNNGRATGVGCNNNNQCCTNVCSSGSCT